MKLYRCTFTGVDQFTNFSKLSKISEKYPYVEWGILYSESKSGKENRYPTLDFIKKFFHDVSPKNNTALHICGAEAYRLIDGKYDIMKICDFYRIQLNVNNKNKEINRKKLKDLILNFSATDFILQMNESNRDICDEDFIANILFDKSGGNGISPNEWPYYNYNKEMCGYAGGLGPDNISNEFEKISKLCSNQSFWIDMENKVRTDDKFDLEKCVNVLEIIDSYIK